MLASVDHRGAERLVGPRAGQLDPDPVDLERDGDDIGYGGNEPVRISRLGPVTHQPDRRARVRAQPVYPSLAPAAQPRVGRVHGDRDDSDGDQAAGRAITEEPIGREEQQRVDGHDRGDEQ